MHPRNTLSMCAPNSMDKIFNESFCGQLHDKSDGDVDLATD